MSVTLTKTERSTISKNISGMKRGDTVTSDGTVIGYYRYQSLRVAILQWNIAQNK